MSRFTIYDQEHARTALRGIRHSLMKELLKEAVNPDTSKRDTLNFMLNRLPLDRTLTNDDVIVITVEEDKE